MPDDQPLPFIVEVKPTEHGKAVFVACRDGKEITAETYTPGSGLARRRTAKLWAQDTRLWDGATPDPEAVVHALEDAERRALAASDEDEDAPENGTGGAPEDEADDESTPARVQAAFRVDAKRIIELAWNYENGRPDFIWYDRQTHVVTRSNMVELSKSADLVVPAWWREIVTPGGFVPGTVFVPTACDETGIDEDRLRQDIAAFVNRYVELPPGASELCTNYILLSWIQDSFAEVPYLAFRTADCGRGKSRALGTVGSLCYRPILAGGGSTAAGVLRLLDGFGGTLCADEMDGRADSELTSELVKILNQGFEWGRPIVRCSGTDNTPKTFKVFGTKVLAFRQGLADDAAESRCISIYMPQRTRRDVPFNLPRQRFDRESLALRNRLLAWRFASLGAFHVNPAHADPRLEDRANQIGLPLFAVARTPERRAVIAEALCEQQGRIAADRGESFAGEVLEAALRVARLGETVTAAEVAKELNRERAERLGVEIDRLRDVTTPKNVGRVLARELELPRAARRARVRPYRLDAGRVAELCRRFGVNPPDGVGEHDQPTLFDPEPEPQDDPELAAECKPDMVVEPEAAGLRRPLNAEELADLQRKHGPNMRAAAAAIRAGKPTPKLTPPPADVSNDPGREELIL